MSIRFDNSGEYAYRASDLPAAATPFTFCGWVYLASDGNRVTCLMTLGNGDLSVRQRVGTTSDGTTLQVITRAGGSDTYDDGTNLSTGTWYHVAHVRNGAAHTLYLNGEVDASITSDISLTPAAILLSDPSGWLNGRLARVRVWTAALSQSEVQAEMRAVTAARATNLHADWPLSSNLNDVSGNDRHLSSVGTVSYEADPPYIATVAPLVVEATMPAVAASGAAGETATVSPLSVEVTPPAVTATYVALLSAAVTPLGVSVAIPAVVATAGTEYTATVAPLAVTTGLPAVTASYVSLLSAATAPLAVLVTLPPVTAWSLPGTSLVLGVMGDSCVDEYRADSGRGGAYAAVTFNPLEAWERIHPDGVDTGAWGTRGEPRRTGYAYNWARDGAYLGTDYGGSNVVTQGQHTGLAAQIPGEGINAVLLVAGSNDFLLGGYDDIYDGTLTDLQVQDKIDSMLANAATAIDAVLTAGADYVVVWNLADPGDGPGAEDVWPNAAGRARCTACIDEINDGLDAIAGARTGVAIADRHALLTDLATEYDYADGEFFILGETIAVPGNGDEPHNAILADGAHTGTVLSAIMANWYIIDAFNDAFGMSIERMTDAEILALVNIATVAPVVVEATLPSVTAAHVIELTAAAAPVVVNVTMPGATASADTLLTAAVSPLGVTATTPGVTASYVSLLSAAVVPVSVSAALPGITATYVSLLSAGVAPLVVQVSIPSVAAQTATEYTAAVEPLAVRATLPAVTAAHVLALGTTVTPVAVAVTLPAVTANTSAVATAAVAPIVVRAVFPATAATYEALLSAVVQPVMVGASFPTVAALFEALVTAAVVPLVVMVTVNGAAAYVGFGKADVSVSDQALYELILSHARAYVVTLSDATR